MSPTRIIAKALAAELLRAEMALLDPNIRRDRSRVAALLTDDFVEFGASGRAWSRDQILELLATEEYAPPIIEDFACHRLAENVVLVTYRTVRVNQETGRRETTLRSSIWTKGSASKSKGSSGWRVRFHQGTRVS
ncbi:MAG: DUF4440 domain-containing protein [Terracidiphilus sp.]